MSGIIPPSVVTYDFPFYLSGDKYINVSFPFRVKIEGVWFTGGPELFGGVTGDWLDAERKVKLACAKFRNAKNPVDAYDSPSDGNNFFGTHADSKPMVMIPDEDLKPTMWLGNPDSESMPEGQLSHAVTTGGSMAFRSTIGNAPDLHDIHNFGWINSGWSEAEHAERSDRTDLSIMNTDEMLTMFPYQAGGNWDDYVNGSAVVTIHVAYSGMWEAGAVQAPARPWTDWWND
jgi:hypothetical protein